jgi:hypothetical protein
MSDPKFPVGSLVRVVSRDQFNGRTGEVVELPGFPWRDHRRVKFDPQPDVVLHHPEKATLIDEDDLRLVRAAERPQPRGQLTLFPEAA